MAIDLIVVMRRLVSGERLVASLTEVSRGRNGEASLVGCVAHDPSTGEWMLEQEPSFVEAALEAGVLGREEVEAWRSCLFSSQVALSA